jgi:YVTN family beta-propeller protein
MAHILRCLTGIALSLTSATVLATVSHVFVSNNGDKTMSVLQCVTSNGTEPIQCKERERLDTSQINVNSSWPANQYQGRPAWWWTGLSGQVVGLKAKSTATPLLDENNRVYVDTHVIPGRPETGANFIGIMPDGRTAWNSAREVDRIQEIDTDPDSPTFGTILTSLYVPDQYPPTAETPANGAARPCDATISPDGRYFFEPDLWGESLTVVDTQQKAIIHQVMPPRADPESVVSPFMATTNGNIVLVENFEDGGTYDVWDVTGLPNEPVHVKKLTRSGDGLGLGPQTSEFTPDGKYAYLIMNGTDSDVAPPELASRLDVLDVMPGSTKYLEIVKSITLPTNCGAHTGDFSNDGRYFFVNCSRADSVAVVDNETQQAVLEIPVGHGPRGIITR